MYVVQSGEVEVVHTTSAGDEQYLAVLREGDFFGEMAIFERAARSATVRAIEEARVLKVDKLTLLRRIKENPLMAFNMLKVLSGRIRDLNKKLAEIDRRSGIDRRSSAPSSDLPFVDTDGHSVESERRYQADRRAIIS